MAKYKKFILLFVVVLFLGVGIFLLFNKGKFSKTKNLILNKEVTLSATDRIFVEKRLAESQLKFDQLKDSQDIISKVNFLFAISADYRILGQYGKAKEKLEEAMSIDPKNSNLIATYSSLISLMGDNHTALIYIDKAISLYSAESNYWTWKLDLEKELGASSFEIEKILKDALSNMKDDVTIITRYATFLAEQNRNNEAIVFWQKAQKLYPNNKEIYQIEINDLLNKK